MMLLESKELSQGWQFQNKCGLLHKFQPDCQLLLLFFLAPQGALHLPPPSDPIPTIQEKLSKNSLFWTECRVNGAFYRRGENYSSRLWIAWTLEWVFVVLLQTYFVKKLWDLNIRGVQKIFSSFSSRKNMWIFPKWNDINSVTSLRFKSISLSLVNGLLFIKTFNRDNRNIQILISAEQNWNFITKILMIILAISRDLKRGERIYCK